MALEIQPLCLSPQPATPGSADRAPHRAGRNADESLEGPVERRRALPLAVLFLCCSIQQPAVAASTADASAIEARREQGEQLYLRIHQVLTHPRCLNCHPKSDSPRQGQFERIHVPPITRGAGGHGPAGLQCSACHQAENNTASGVPGAPHWQLAPRSMAWEGLSPGQLCRALNDRKKNGNRSVAATVKHLTADELVGWGWHPGTDAAGKPREPVPIPKEEFVGIVHAWAKVGAPCPK
jgi:hypothetical protein